jgi:hypothetical protein
MDHIGTDRGNDSDGRPVYADIYYYCHTCGHCAVVNAPLGRVGMPRCISLTPYQIVRVLKLKLLTQGGERLVTIQSHWEKVAQSGLPTPSDKRESRT